MTQLATGNATPMVQRMTAMALILLSSQPTLNALNYAYLTRTVANSATICRGVAAMSGTAIWPTPGPVCAMAIAFMAHGNRSRATGLTQPSCCSTLAPVGSRAS